MIKDVLNNVVELLQHIYEGIHESIEKDLSDGGYKKVAQNKFVIGLFVLLVLCLAIPMFTSSSMDVSYESQSEKAGIPEDVIKRVVMAENLMNMKDPGEMTVKEIKIGKIYDREVDGQKASCVEYEMDLKAKNIGEKHTAGTVILQKRGNGWFRYFEATKTWAST